MKILLIGFYDYSYYSGACVLENNKLEKINLSDEDYAIIQHRYWMDFDGEDYMAKYLKLKERLFSQFDMVIMCDNGEYELLKGMRL